MLDSFLRSHAARGDVFEHLPAVFLRILLRAGFISHQPNDLLQPVAKRRIRKPDLFFHPVEFPFAADERLDKPQLLR